MNGIIFYNKSLKEGLEVGDNVIISFIFDY